MRRLRLWLHGVVLCLALLSSAGVAGVEDDQTLVVARPPRTGRELARADFSCKNSFPELLVVVLLDGRVVALEADSGQVLWTFASGSPLLSSQQSGLAKLARMAVFPGVDGGLYAYHGTEGANAKLERLPITLPQLVDTSPSMTDDGSVIMGKRLTTVYLLDRATGRVIRTLSELPGSLEDHQYSDGGGLGGGVDGSGAALLSSFVSDPDSVVAVGREDYIVRSVQMATGAEVWNATFSRMTQLSPVRGAGGVAAAAGRQLTQPWRRSTTVGDASCGSWQTPRLAVGAADSSLQAFDPVTGFRKWSVAFDALPVAAYTGSAEGVNHLQPLSSTGGPGGTTVAAPLVNGGSSVGGSRVSGQLAGGTAVLVGALPGGTVYALPADHVALDLSPASGSSILVAAPGQQQEQQEHQPSPEAAANAVLVIHESSVQLVAAPFSGEPSSEPDATQASGALVLRPVDADKAPAVVDSLTCPTGLHLVNGSSAVALPWLPGAALALAQKGAAGPQSSGLAVAAKLLLLAVLLLAVPALLLFGGQGRSAPLWRRRLAGTLPAGAAGTGDATVRVEARVQQPAAAAEQIAADGSGSSNSGSSSSSGQPKGAKKRGRGKSNSGPDSNGSAAPRSSDVAAVSGADDDGGHAASAAAAAGGPSAAAGGGSGGSSGGAMSALQRVKQIRPDGSFAIGRLVCGPSILGYGSAGTVVYDGLLDGRAVAVKRLLRQFYDLARKEIEVLIVSDEHPNVVRCFAMEEDTEFVYLALERCRATLAETLGTPQGREAFAAAGGGQRRQDAMYEIAAGLAALHERGIVHRDLKPHNVLLTDSGRAKLSDMGLSKQLVAEQSSFESHGAGGSSGWQAPEQLIARGGGVVRQSRSMDVFSLGCVLFFTATLGQHPFGDNYERDANILNGEPRLDRLREWPEAANLVAAMLAKDASQRPVMQAVLGHPTWWSVDTKLQFLIDVSDRVEYEDREPDPACLTALEALAPSCIPANGNWGSSMDAELISNLGRYRRYDYTSVRDLLRVVRNKRNHFREMPPTLQALLGPLPAGFLRYFTHRFPHLLLACFFFGLEHLQQEEGLKQYWPGGPALYRSFADAFRNRRRAMGQQHHAAAAAGGGFAAAAAAGTVTHVAHAQHHQQRLMPVAEEPSSPAASGTPQSPPRRAASRSSDAASPAPPPAGPFAGALMTMPAAPLPSSPLPAGQGSAVAAAAAGGVVVGYVVDEQEDSFFKLRRFPRRPDAQICDFYSRTGHCKWGDDCKFDHPDEFAVKLSRQSLPLRPGEPVCAFYFKTAACKFGATCKFHHPPLKPVFANSASPVDALMM